MLLFCETFFCIDLWIFFWSQLVLILKIIRKFLNKSWNCEIQQIDSNAPEIVVSFFLLYVARTLKYFNIFYTSPSSFYFIRCYTFTTFFPPAYSLCLYKLSLHNCHDLRSLISNRCDCFSLLFSCGTTQGHTFFAFRAWTNLLWFLFRIRWRERKKSVVKYLNGGFTFSMYVYDFRIICA